MAVGILQQNIKWQIKLLGLSMKLLGTPNTYISYNLLLQATQSSYGARKYTFPVISSTSNLKVHETHVANKSPITWLFSSHTDTLKIPYLRYSLLRSSRVRYSSTSSRQYSSNRNWGKTHKAELGCQKTHNSLIHHDTL